VTDTKFSRSTVIAAADILKSLGHSGLDRVLLEFDLSDSNVGRGGGGLLARTTALAQFALQRAGELTANNSPVEDAIVRKAAFEEAKYKPGAIPNVSADERQNFRESLRRDGFDIGKRGEIIPHLPQAPLAERPPPGNIDFVKGNPPKATQNIARVFVVHGHDDAAKESVARYLEKIGFEAVILHERPNRGRSIMTKFREEAADIGFAIVLVTPDDFGGKAGGVPQSRARQNVILELGFFLGALGPERVVTLVRGKVERPSDFDGVLYLSLDDGLWRSKLAKELEAAGYQIDWAKASA
jgi:hypothetical protein